jgi:signal peptidase I
MKKDEDRVVLRRGMVAHDWEKPRVAQDRAEPAGRPPQRSRLPHAHLSRWMLLLIVATLAACTIGLIFALSFRSFEAQGSSMEPELSGGDGLLVARIVYEELDFGLFDWLPLYDSSDLRWGSPGRGDVIVFDSPVRDEHLVKRVVGLPGDTVRIRAGRVYVNGEELDEPYAQGSTACLRTCDDVLIQDGHYFVLGDNRAESVDSRQGWTVPRGDVVGKVLLSY